VYVITRLVVNNFFQRRIHTCNTSVDSNNRDKTQIILIVSNYTGQHTKCIRNQTVDSSSIQCAEFKYGLRIQFLALVVMIYEVWLDA
jgi:hypothetical protein